MVVTHTFNATVQTIEVAGQLANLIPWLVCFIVFSVVAIHLSSFLRRDDEDDEEYTPQFSSQTKINKVNKPENHWFKRKRSL